MRFCILFFVGISVCSAASLPESFDQRMSRARYADVRAVERVELYQDLLRAINRGYASEPETREFVSHVLGMLKQRRTDDVVTLRALSDLVKSILMSRVAVLQGNAQSFSQWKDVLEADLARFALVHGDVVKIVLSNAPGHALAVLPGTENPALDFAEHEGLPTFFKLAVRNKEAGGGSSQPVIVGGEKFDIVPMYWEHSGVACSLDGGLVTQFRGDVMARRPTVMTARASDAENLPLRVIKRDRIPAYTGEQVFVSHPGCGEWPMIIERVAPEALGKLENENLHQVLERIKAIPGALDKIRWLQSIQGNFNERVSEKNLNAAFKLFSGMMALRTQHDNQTLLALRQLIESYEAREIFKDQTRYLVEWKRALNKLLEPHAIKFEDVVKISGIGANGACLCVAPYVTSSKVGYTKEIRLGLGPVHGSGHGHSLISLVSHVGKHGHVSVGDEVELALPHVDGGSELRCVIVPSDGSGGGRVLALNLQEIPSDADNVFVIDGVIKSGGSGEERGAPLVNGDPFVLRSKKTQKILGARSSAVGSLWTMIEPVASSAHRNVGVVTQFSINAMPVTAVTNVVTKSFYDKLSSIKQEVSVYAKVARLMQLLDTFSPKVEVGYRDDFWDVVALIVADKKRMNEHELGRVIELLNKIVVVATVNGVTPWASRATQALKDVEFYKKMRRALAVPGMDRFKSLLELAPEVKGISLSEAHDFVAALKSLRRYKKDQSRAAKLLLSQVADDIALDSSLTGSGNLLVP